MKTRLLTFLCAVVVGLTGLAQPKIITIVHTEDNQVQEISLAANEVVEVHTAYDFYGAGSSLAIKKAKAQFNLVPGNAAGGLPHCQPHPFLLVGPAELTVQSGNSQGARTLQTPFVVTLEIRRVQSPPAPAKSGP